MSTYPQYQYPQGQYPQQPPAGQQPTAPGAGEPKAPAAGPTYVPIETLGPPDATDPWWQSQRSIQHAAGADPLVLHVAVPDAAVAAKSYPLLMYNKKTRDAHVVKDDKEKAKYTAKGYSEDPFPPQDPNALTPQDVQALTALLAKAGDAIQKLAAAQQSQQPPAQPPAK